MKWLEQSREIPVPETYDVLVAGGGIAGVAAALAAARAGARTCLLERACAPGGLATLGLVAVYLPLCDGLGRQVAGGLAEELFRAAYRYAPDRYPRDWPAKGRLEAPFEPAPMMLALEAMLLEAGVDIHYDTRVCAVRMAEGRLEGVIAESKRGRMGVGCRMAVDATGDADLCRMAGERVSVRETASASAWNIRWQRDHLQLITGCGGRLETPLLAEDVTALLLQERACIRAFMDSVPDKAEFPAIINLLPQFRKTARLVNGFELNRSDAKSAFPDAIGQIGDWQKPGPVYALPYRMLAASRCPNLVTAGRCVAVAEDLWDVTRVIPACAVTGQAAGAACALACQTGQTVQALDVSALRALLAGQGALLPG